MSSESLLVIRFVQSKFDPSLGVAMGELTQGFFIRCGQDRDVAMINLTLVRLTVVKNIQDR